MHKWPPGIAQVGDFGHKQAEIFAGVCKLIIQVFKMARKCFLFLFIYSFYLII